MSRDWSREEVRAAIDEYFEMLLLEVEAAPYSKAEHRRRLLPRIDGRSEGSVEWKHRNISAVLLELNCPYIDGYKPAPNRQALLVEEVQEQLLARPELRRKLEEHARSEPSALPPVRDILRVMEPPPSLAEPPTLVRETSHVPVPRTPDYLAIEAGNHKLGQMGEIFVLSYERARLRHAGRDNLADRVEHVSVTVGDGLGYDIRSYEPDGSDRFVEVKTTAYGKETPFYLSSNELRTSREEEHRFHLHRVFAFRRSPRMFTLPGDLTRTCRLRPTQYRARPYSA